ncbi:MurR/RpiR family transcriptional regulator [Rhodovulum sp. DZ06]|uniref:MurR/RpiR family transcriptional regulator n=1 Tax=Rhodovulum sp. DZ06 TaxID=3425126 RepID=UPI003D331C4A
MPSPPPETIEELRRALAEIARGGSPRLASLALWALDSPEEIAFQSVRGLAELSGANPNTVFRLARAMGFAGYDECRQAFQRAIRPDAGIYRERVERLQNEDHGALLSAAHAAALRNVDDLYAPENLERIARAAEILRGARKVYCVGVRSCHALAHYLAYTGRMAFPGFEPASSHPGGIADLLVGCGPDDVVIPMTFRLYSTETVRAHALARRRGAKVIAITDSYASPVAEGAEIVFTPMMEGPQMLPSLAPAFALAEILVAEMAAGSAEAGERISTHERRLLEHGAYLP